jgi:hypothetical protein
MALQPVLGILPEWRAGIGSSSDHRSPSGRQVVSWGEAANHAS